MHYHGHRARLRQLVKENPTQVADYEILELLLGYVLLRSDTKPLSKDLLERFQSIKGVLEAKPAELLSVKGFGPSLETFWVLLNELMSRRMESALRRREILATPEAVAKIARVRLASCPHEENWIAYVDTQNRLLRWEKFSKGTLDHSIIYTRDILERAISLKSSGFILVHNHPGGNVQPSRADLQTTAMLKESAKHVGLRFLDHIIVTDESCYSLMNDGLM